MIARHAPVSYEVPPREITPPSKFEGTDLYPAVTINASRAVVSDFCDLIEQEDELGPCLVAHFEVNSTLVMVYQSGLDAKDRWTVFVDMIGCVVRQQYPTRLGAFVVRYWTAGTIVPEWVNADADRVYRSRVSKSLLAVPGGADVVKSSPAGASEHLPLPIIKARRQRDQIGGSLVDKQEVRGQPSSDPDLDVVPA